MRRLVVCCDGTWQNAAADSNVARLHRAHRAEPGSPAAEYVPGVGTSAFNPVANLRAGLTGAGLDRSIMDGYRFLVDAYRRGDRILAITAPLPSDSLRAMIRRLNVTER